MSGHTPWPQYPAGGFDDHNVVEGFTLEEYGMAAAAFNATYAAGINPEAVPLMLKALRALAATVMSDDWTVSHADYGAWVRDRARAAIAKATEVQP